MVPIPSPSVLDLFRVGIGPSSSHTVGPMRAARDFAVGLAADGRARRTARVRVQLYGSLGATGRGHRTDGAVLLGLAGYRPETVPADVVRDLPARVAARGELPLVGGPTVRLDASDVEFLPSVRLPFHPNALRLSALDATGATLATRVYYSVGGGFVVDEDQARTLAADAVGPAAGDAAVPEEHPEPPYPSTPEKYPEPPYPFTTAVELLRRCEEAGTGVAGVMAADEAAARDPRRLTEELLAVAAAMDECIEAGCRAQEGLLPGVLRVPRRAPGLLAALRERDAPASRRDRALCPPGPRPPDPAADGDPLGALDWVNLYALAVCEENAAGHRVVTAPTNGAAGILPAVLRYWKVFVPGADDAGTVRFLLAAGAIGILVKRNASIAGAEVGCQGEVGSACAMAAAGLAEVMGGTPLQVENAAEIAMEHNLGLTCDPVGGLVQIPCIERNAIAAVKAIDAARMALHGTGRHMVSLDSVIRTMRDTGADMHAKYKETSLGGLAVNVIEC